MFRNKKDKELKRIRKYCHKALKTKDWQFNILLHLYERYLNLNDIEKSFNAFIENSVNEDFYITNSDLLNDSALTIEINGMDKKIRQKLIAKFVYFYFSGINRVVGD